MKNLSLIIITTFMTLSLTSCGTEISTANQAAVSAAGKTGAGTGTNTGIAAQDEPQQRILVPTADEFIQATEVEEAELNSFVNNCKLAAPISLDKVKSDILILEKTQIRTLETGEVSPVKKITLVFGKSEISPTILVLLPRNEQERRAEEEWLTFPTSVKDKDHTDTSHAIFSKMSSQKLKYKSGRKTAEQSLKYTLKDGSPLNPLTCEFADFFQNIKVVTENNAIISISYISSEKLYAPKFEDNKGGSHLLKLLKDRFHFIQNTNCLISAEAAQ